MRKSKGWSASVSLPELQRHVAILLKAESEMAHSGFARLIMEMALVKMATLAPVVPVNEILEPFKVVAERTADALIASSQPAWKASGPQDIEQSTLRSNAKRTESESRHGGTASPPHNPGG